MTVYKEGQPILYKGEKLTQNHIEILQALNLYGTKANLFKFVAIFLFTSLLFLLLERFIYYFNRKIYTHVKYFFLTFFVIFILIF